MPYSSKPGPRPRPGRKAKIAFAKELRQNQSPPEIILWAHIRQSKLGVTFTRQKVLLGWIADFYCAKLKLVIEVDGKQHYGVAHAMKDRYRDKVMAEAGIRVVRIPAKLVFSDIPMVLRCIRHHIAVASGDIGPTGR